MADLFISYSRDDQEVARRFAENLKREGFEVWWDQALNPGEAFDQVTEEALAAAAAVIVLWSKTSVGSRWVRAEATQANADRRLLPVMVEACKRPIMFELTHTADLSSWKGNRDDAAWQAFVASVRRFVQRRGNGDQAFEAGSTAAAPPPPGPTLGERLASFGAALGRSAAWVGSTLWRNAGRIAFALLFAAIGAWLVWLTHPQIEPEVVRFSIALPAELRAGTSLALSPDGRRLAFRNGSQLFSRRLDQDLLTRIPGIDDAQTLPFFSPDSRSLAYFGFGPAGAQLKAFDFGSEATRVLANTKDVPGVVGSWDEQGQIVFDKVGSFGLFQVAAVGGEPEEFATLGSYNVLRFPQLLPGGNRVLFTAYTVTNSTWSSADIVVQNVTSGERKIVLKGGHFARYVPSGHLLFVRNGTLYAVAFDPDKLVTSGREVPVVQGVLSDELNGLAVYAVADNGTLAYQPGGVAGAGGGLRDVVRADRSGALTVLSAEPRNYSSPRASPDGSKIAAEVTGEDQRVRIWVMDARTGTATQLTFDGDEDRYPLWSADGSDVLYTSRRGAQYAIWRKAADGSGTERHVIDGTEALAASDVHDNTLVFQEKGEGEERDLFILDLEAGGPARPLLATPDDEVGGRISPDGRWIAYVLTPRAGGALDRRVYVRPFPGTATGGQRAVSDGQGAGVEWTPAGNEILYSMNGAANTPLMAVPVTTTATTLTPGAPRPLFGLADKFQFTQTGTTYRYGYTYGVLPGENAIIGIALTGTTGSATGDEDDAVSPHLNVVLNWFEELKRLVPVD